jgi:hypothetical protein
MVERVEVVEKLKITADCFAVWQKNGEGALRLLSMQTTLQANLLTLCLCASVVNSYG